MLQFVCDRCHSILPHGATAARIHLETIVGEGMPIPPERFDVQASRMYNLEVCERCFGDLKSLVALASSVHVRG